MDHKVLICRIGIRKGSLLLISVAKSLGILLKSNDINIANKIISNVSDKNSGLPAYTHIKCK